MTMIRGVILDLDGTVYAGAGEIPGAVQFIARLRNRGVKPLFVTNRANRTPEQVCAQLQAMGVTAAPAEILTAAEATAAYLKSGSVFLIGGEGIEQAVRRMGMTITEHAPDYVIVSFDSHLTYEKLEKACLLINNGAKFIATNPDVKLKTESGFSPGTGAIVAAVSAATGASPLVIGKPQKLIFEIALERLGMTRDEVVVVGDNIDTDVPAGLAAGLRTALVLTGVSTPRDVEHSIHKPTWVARDFEELWNRLHTDSFLA